MTGRLLAGLADSLMNRRLDEVRIAAIPQTAAWLAVQQASMTDALLDYGAAEPR